ncbi:MAG: T9SS type A sorting domain-containing protein [Bacteroidia bacterium]
MKNLTILCLTAVFLFLGSLGDVRGQCPTIANNGSNNITLTYSAFGSAITQVTITVGGKGTAVYSGGQISGATTTSVTLTLTSPTSGVSTIVSTDQSSASAGIVTTDGSTSQTCNTLTTLPATLTTFTGKLLPNKVLLNWATVTEINNDKFDVERSINGVDFIKVGEVKGNGNSDQLIKYTYSDNTIGELLATTLFYRLKQVDYNGEFEYSPTTLVKKTNTLGTVTVFPNPATTTLNVELNNSELVNNTLQVIGLDGKIYLQSNIETQSASLDVSSLAKGVYFLKVLSADIAQAITVQKLIIQ